MKKIFTIIFITLYATTLLSQTSNQKDSINPAKEKDIIKLLKLSGTADFAYIIIDDVIDNYKQYVQKAPPEYWDKLAVNVDIMPFIKSIIPVYDKRFTHAEIKELINFFNSPVGNKWALALKDMNQEVMDAANKFGQQIFININKKLLKDGYIAEPEIEKPEENNKNPQNK